MFVAKRWQLGTSVGRVGTSDLTCPWLVRAGGLDRGAKVVTKSRGCHLRNTPDCHLPARRAGLSTRQGLYQPLWG
jgi:hypothetical protein